MIDQALEFARWYFYMHSRPEDSEVTRYQNCIQVQKTLGREPLELQQRPEMPEECSDLWEAFTRLSCCSYTEIKAYIELTGNILSSWEIDALIGLDRIRSNHPKVYTWQT